MRGLDVAEEVSESATCRLAEDLCHRCSNMFSIQQVPNRYPTGHRWLGLFHVRSILWQILGDLAQLIQANAGI